PEIQRTPFSIVLTATAWIRYGARVAPPSPDSASTLNVSIAALDRTRLERLARYVSRPAVSTERLSQLPDGRLLYRLKRRWRNGTTEVVFQRSDFFAKLAALVPAPRAHLRTYHGILAPAAIWRPR